MGPRTRRGRDGSGRGFFAHTTDLPTRAPIALLPPPLGYQAPRPPAPSATKTLPRRFHQSSARARDCAPLAQNRGYSAPDLPHAKFRSAQPVRLRADYIYSDGLPLPAVVGFVSRQFAPIWAFLARFRCFLLNLRRFGPFWRIFAVFLSICADCGEPSQDERDLLLMRHCLSLRDCSSRLPR